MTQPALQRFAKKVFLAKIETTENVAIALDPTVDALLLLNGAIATAYVTTERPIDRLFWTNNPFGVSNETVEVSADFELFSPTTPGVGSSLGLGLCANDVLLKTAGLTSVFNAGAKTTKYNPISDAIPTATWGGYHADAHYVGLGARGDISSLKMMIGAVFTGKGKWQGNYQPVTTGSPPTPTLYTNVPVTSTYDNSEMYVTAPSSDSPSPGTELKLRAKSLEVVFGNALKSKEFTSYKTQSISDRKATFNFVVAKADLADFHPWTLRKAGTIINLRYRTYESGVFAQLNGLYSELGVRGQIEAITETNVDNDICWTITGRCVASNAGGDELYVQSGDDTFGITGTYTGGASGAVSFLPSTVGRSTAPLVWSATGLPAGVTISSSTGALSGTSTAGGPYAVVITATDANTTHAQVASKTFTVTYT